MSLAMVLFASAVASGSRPLPAIASRARLPAPPPPLLAYLGQAPTLTSPVIAPLAPVRPPAALAHKVRLGLVASGLDEPVGLEIAPADPRRRLFVVEKGGRIRILKDGRLLSRPFLDLRGRVSRGAEQGLLGLAFHPRYVRNGRFFVNYTDLRGDTRIVEYAVSSDPDRADPAAVREWLFLDQPFSNHNGGALVFGPDGALWIGTGDGGSANDPLGHAQNPRSLFGKMLRLEVDAGGSPEIVMTGLRNPWRYSWDRATRDLYIADVGQNRYEEIDVLPLERQTGANLGWPLMEGRHCRAWRCNEAAFTLPVLEYTHADGCSITGGYVYRGKALPELTGHYFYSDWCTAWIRSFRLSGGMVRDSYDWREILDPERRLAQVTSFGQDHAGELYVISQEGTIFRLERAE